MIELTAHSAPFLATFALVIAPGPAVLYIITRSVEQGRAAGFASAAGIATGGLVHVAGAALGLSALLASSALAFSFVKYLGAAYLIFLGLRTMLSRPTEIEFAAHPSRPLSNLYSQGILVQALNPKVALFFLAFLPQFIEPTRGSILQQTLLLGAMFIVVGLCTDSLYALVAGTAGDWLKRQPAFTSVQRYVAGMVFIGLGISTALSGSKSK